MTTVAPIMMMTNPAAASEEARPDAQKPGKDQAQRAEHLGQADEPQEPPRQRHRPRHLVERQNQFRAAC
jgi:hypothetical protein